MCIGFYAWRIMFNNFAVEQFDASPTDIGIIQAVREIPGLLAFTVGIIAMKLTESRIVALSIILMGIGLIVCGVSPSLVVLGMATFVLSIGFHYFEPTNSSQLLLLAKNSNLGRVQGVYRSYESLAGLVGGLMILGMTLFLSYEHTFYIIGGLVTLVGIYLVLALPPNRGKSDNRKMVIKKKYWLYYVLYFLRGCRRHVFTTFAIFLLVKNHGLSISMVSIVILASNLVTFFTNRWMGNLTDKLGERLILAGSSLLLIFIFTGYAYIDYLPVLIIFYLIDNTLFNSAIALRSYLTKISSSEDLTGCLAFGMTSNHVAAVVIPVAGGIIWSYFGHEITFLIGAGIVFIDMVFSFMVPGKKAL
ncbi:MAG: MFS transporter [candidate division Zixibacteria bacterium]|nr:MFS transporter [candidate division Zixibacteria bacterium]